MKINKNSNGDVAWKNFFETQKFSLRAAVSVVVVPFLCQQFVDVDGSFAKVEFSVADSEHPPEFFASKFCTGLSKKAFKKETYSKLASSLQGIQPSFSKQVRHGGTYQVTLADIRDRILLVLKLYDKIDPEKV